ncbi:MAG: choice-of-anchor V domain-containing protein [Candidatus Thermoplasmatota archaeon]|nr:choice-of-anchor V domain-containing protein [Candidatus Thermoplasmatota archaeon]
MRAVVVVLVLALLSQVAVSAPSGIGKSANEGCLCHGDRDQSTTVWIEGLPESYESNTIYNFSIIVESEKVAANPNGSIGGFRMLVVGGSITFDESAGLIQELDDGWTHTESGNMVRSWNLSFVSPEDNASYVDFKVYGNAVNGNQASSEDAWNSLSLRLPGVEYDGEIFSDQADGFSPMDYSVGLVSMVALVGLLIITLRD